MSVNEWGKGKPDYFVPTVSSTPTIITESEQQESWTLTTTFTMGGATSVISSIYTVPDGYTLQLGSLFISCSESVINKVRLLKDNEVIIGDLFYDMKEIVSWSSITGQTIVENSELVLYLWNNLSDASNITATFSGVLNRS